MERMKLPPQLHDLRDRRIWLCYPMIWNDSKHNGVGGYDKPPVNPRTLFNGSSDDPESLTTFDEAVSQIGKLAKVRVKGHENMIETEIVGVGIALSGTGLLGLDLDNVVATKENCRYMTSEAGEIVRKLDTYTEVSPSGQGLHMLLYGELSNEIGKKIAKPKRDIFKTDKAEYQIFSSGYMTISGDIVGDRKLEERSEELLRVYDDYFREVAPIPSPSTARPHVSSSVVSSGYTFERWLEEIARLSDAEILERIFKSGDTGEKVRSLYYGNMTGYNNDHSRADQALVSLLYGFTEDRDMTERLFRSSSLYRPTGKSRNYLTRTINLATKNATRLIGHIEFTQEERRTFAREKDRPRTWGDYAKRWREIGGSKNG